MNRWEMINELVELDVLRFTDEHDWAYLQEKLRKIFRKGHTGYAEYTNEGLKDLIEQKRGE
jgi:homoserine trans-succinylase